MFKWLDRSSVLARLLESVSGRMTRRRGVPVIFGIVCVTISLIAQAINIYTGSEVLELIGVVALHVGILSALIGLLMAEALGG